MNIRNEYKFSGQQFIQWNNGQPLALNFSWEANFSRKREQLAELIKQCGLFDARTINVFNQSRLPDGTYKIDAGDSTLINIAKCVISLLHTLENMNPSLILPLASYMQSNSWVTTSINYVSFLGNYLYQRSRLITQFKFHSRNLSYYLSRFKSEAGALAGINHALLDAITQLSGQIGKNLQPFLDQIRVMQLLPEDDNELAQHPEHDLEPLTIPPSADNAAANSKTLSIATRAVCGSIDELKKRVDALLQNNNAITPDPLTGVYREDSTEDPTAQNLLHAANIMSRFKAALIKVERTINHHELHVLDVCRDLGCAIKELQQINIESIKQITAVELQILIKLILSGVEPILVEIILFFDIANSRLDINNPAIQEHFDNIFHSYQTVARTMGITLKHTYPYWPQRLALRQQELKQKDEARKQIINARSAVENIVITEQTSLADLLAARKAARIIGSPNMYYYEKEINRLISARTGMNLLASDIARAEQQARTTSGEIQTSALKKLSALYARRRELEDRLEKIASGNIFLSHNFSYQREQTRIVEQSISLSWYNSILPLSARRISGPKASTIQAANQLLAGLDRGREKLQRQVAEAAEHIIAARVHLHSEQVNALIELKRKIENITPLSFYSMSITELRRLFENVRLLRHPEAGEYENIVKHALEDRAGITALNDEAAALEKSIADMQGLEYTLQANIEYLKYEHPDWANADNTSAQLLKQVRVLKLYRDLIDRKLAADDFQQPDDKTIANIGSKLEISSNEVLKLLASEQEWSEEPESFNNPLIIKMDARICALEDTAKILLERRHHIDALTERLAACKANHVRTFDDLKLKLQQTMQLKEMIAANSALESLPQHPYQGRDLDKLKNETTAVCPVLRNCLHNIAAYNASFVTDITPPPTTHTDSAAHPVEEERSDQENLKRIINKYKGGLIVKSELIREKIFASSMRFLTPEQQNNFNTTKLPSGVYIINMTDPVLVKNLKSLLNTLRRCEEATIRILPHLRNISAGKGHVPCAVIGLPTTHEAVLELQLELKDFAFHLEQLQTAFPHLLNILDLPAVKNINSLAAMALAAFRDVLVMPEISSMMNINVTSQIEQVLITINTLAQTSGDTKYDIAFAPLQSTIQALDEFIFSRYQLQRGKNGSFKIKEAGVNRDLKDLLTLANTMSTVLKTLYGLVNIADAGPLTEIVRIATRSFTIYRKVMHLYKTRIPEIKAGLKYLFEQIHPFLVKTAANAELVEVKFGMQPEQFITKYGSLYRKFEKAAAKLGVTFSSNYPYTYEKLEILNTELEIEKRKRDDFSCLLKIIADNDPNQTYSLNVARYSLIAFVKLRDLLRQLPPSATHLLLPQIELAIARRTGLSGIEDGIVGRKKSLADSDHELARLESVIAGIQNDISLLEREKSSMDHFRAGLQNHQLLTGEDIEHFHRRYSALQQNLTLASFCHLVVEKSALIETFLLRSCDDVDNQLRINNQELQEIQARRQTLAHAYTRQQKQLEQDENLADALRKRISEVTQPSLTVREFTCNNGRIVDNAFTPYTAGMIDYKPGLPVIIDQYYRFHDGKVNALSAKLAEMTSQHQEYLTAIFAKQREQLESAEKSVGLAPGTLTSLIPDNVDDLKKCSQTACELTHLRGVLSTYIGKHAQEIPSNYALILAQPASASALAKEISREAGKESSSLGRFFRRIIGRPSMGDNVYNMAKYFPPKPEPEPAPSTPQSGGNLLTYIEKPEDRPTVTSTAVITAALDKNNTAPARDTDKKNVANNEEAKPRPAEPAAQPTPTPVLLIKNVAENEPGPGIAPIGSRCI